MLLPRPAVLCTALLLPRPAVLCTALLLPGLAGAGGDQLQYSSRLRDAPSFGACGCLPRSAML